jgi:hypothetical protein
MKEAERLDVEAKKRAIIQEHTDKILQRKGLHSNGITIAQEGYCSSTAIA